MSANKHATQQMPLRVALFFAIAILLAASFAARFLLAPALVDWVGRVSHGSPAWMFTAGWAITAFAPAAALVFLLDGNRRERQLGDDPLHRPRAAHGHGVPGRGRGYWTRRLPLLVALLVAVVVFRPSRGGNQDVWHDALGGDAFGKGWRLSGIVSALAVLALLIFKILTMLPGHRDRLLRVAGPLTVAAPALALLGLFTVTH